MESSFFEYRDETGDNSGIIDDSYLDESFAAKKTPARRNQTAYIPESDDDVSGDDSTDEQEQQKSPNSICHKRYCVNEPFVLSSSDDDKKKSSLRRTSNFTTDRIVTSSSEEEGPISPEMVPRRRPFGKPRRSSDETFIARKNKKRIMLIESDTDNSILIEQNKNRKVMCLQDTPVKIDSGANKLDIQNMSIESDLNQLSDETVNCSTLSDKKDDVSNDLKYKEHEESKRAHDAANVDHSEVSEVYDDTENYDNGKTENRNRHSCKVDVSDDEHDEEAMVMSRATRMSNMGIIPKENDSDNSDFMQSDEFSHPSSGSETSLPEVTLKSPEKAINESRPNDNSSVTDDENDEDAKNMSKAIRLSIMGVVPKDSESDNSDYSQSEPVSTLSFRK